MIRLRHALQLANTKLRSKRVLLFISIVISSILFAALIAAIILFTAAQKSAVNFVAKANNGVYRVEVAPVIPSSVYSRGFDLSIEDIRSIKAIEKQYYAEVAAKYAAAGVKYDATTEVPALMPSAFASETLPEEQRVRYNFASPVVQYEQNIRMAAYAKTAKNKISDLKLVGARYGATGYYEDTHFGLSQIPNMKVLQNGKEDFADNEAKYSNSMNESFSIHNGDYLIKDVSLLTRYLLPIADADKGKGIPVVVSAQEVAKLFGKEVAIGEQPDTPKEKSAWLQSIQTKFAGYTYQACYRNAAEIEKIEMIQRDYATMTNNKGNKEYQPPALQYNLPTTPCGDITVKQDTRSAAEKKITDQQHADQKKLGNYVDPRHQPLTFQIVGIINLRPYSLYSANIGNYLENLLAADMFSSSAYIPKQLYETIPDSLVPINDVSADQQEAVDIYATNGLMPHVLDFPTVAAARDFIANETCPSGDSGCKKLFTSTPYGSNYLLLDEIGKVFSKFMSYALPVVLGLAAIIIWFTMMRVMAENRKETAVYRAMGARRRDIMAIYLTYGMIIALRIALFSLTLGVAAAFMVHAIYSPQLTDIAVASFGTITDGLQFNLFDITSPYMYFVLLSIFAVSFVAILQPLVRSVRRSPINDMRNE